MEKQRDERYRKRVVVLVAAPFQGHLTPMLELGYILHSKGFSITIAHTLFNSPNPRNHPHFLFLPFSDGTHNTAISSHNLTTITSTLNTNCVSPLTQLLLLHMTQQNIVCLIYDGLMYFADSVATQLNIPSLLLRTTCVTNLLAYHALLHQQTHAYLPNFKDEGWREMEVPNLEAMRFKDLPIFNSSPDSDASLKELNKTVGVRPSLGVIFNTVDCLEAQYINQLHQQYLKKVPIFPIGPLHLINAHQSSSTSFLKEDYSCIDWLNKQSPRSVLYVSLGSIASWDQKQLTQMARGLANSNHHFLWVVRGNNIINIVGDDDDGGDVKKGIEERGCVVRWAPQKEVLAHEAVGGFWSHCGWNSTLESMCEGVPMICQPYFGDQTVNSRLVTHVWKVGLQIDNNNNNNNAIQEGDIEKAVRRLLVDEEGKEMWKRAQEMKHHIRQAVTPAGSSYNALDRLLDHILSA